MVTETKLGEGGEELATPQAVVLLFVIEHDKDVITDAKSLKLGSGEGLSCHGDAEVLVRAGVGG